MWENAAYLAAEVSKEPSDVIMVCHSKGCVDTLNFLITPEFKEVTQQVKGLVTMNAPFYGTEFADLSVYYASYLRGLEGEVMEWLGGTALVGHELTTTFRKKYMNTMEKEIEELTNRIPVLSVVSNLLLSSKDDSFFAELGKLQRKLYRIDTDGIVGTKSGILPGSCFAIVMNINHKDILWDNDLMNSHQVLNASLKGLESCR